MLAAVAVVKVEGVVEELAVVVVVLLVVVTWVLLLSLLPPAAPERGEEGKRFNQAFSGSLMERDRRTDDGQKGEREQAAATPATNVALGNQRCVDKLAA